MRRMAGGGRLTVVAAEYRRQIEPLALGWRHVAWNTGVFDTGYRPFTEHVEGTICIPHHLVMVTLRGQAQSVEVNSSCGHCYRGVDRPGAVSFVPGGCERRLTLRGVESEWASISLDPRLFDSADHGERSFNSISVPAFTNVEDAFISGMVAEMARLNARDTTLDATYCDAMSWALAHYIAKRYGTKRPGPNVVVWKLAPWQVRRVADYIDAHLAEPLRIAQLAEVVSVSPGYFHRAFKATVGKTPLAFINERRITRAMALLKSDLATMAAIALQVGFDNPSHFTRVFRQVTGVNPSEFRRGGRIIGRG
jgi:AraC family transcriptional regulator